MIFNSQFETLLERLENSMACMLMGFDGISVVSVAKEGMELDLEMMGAEISAFVNQLRKASFVAQFGVTREFTFRSESSTILLRVLTDDYFVALVVKPEAHIGKGRFLLSLIEEEMVKELN